MPRLFRSFAVLTVAATALSLSSASALLAGPASAATPTLTVTASWVYPGSLAFSVHGTPTAPSSTTTDASGTTAHRADWSVLALPVSTACPTTVAEQNAYSVSDDGAWIAEGEPDTATFSYAHKMSAHDAFPNVYKALHLCAMMSEEQAAWGADGSQTEDSLTITAMADTLVPARVPHVGVETLSAYIAPKIRATGGCVDRWTTTRLTAMPCALGGTMTLSVTKAVAHKWKLPSTVIGRSTLHPTRGFSFYYSYFTISSAMNKALKHDRRHGGTDFKTTLTSRITSPLRATMTKTYAYGTYGISLCSWAKSCPSQSEG